MQVRELGQALGIASESVWRHPFPGPGLAIRVLGEITRDRLAILRHADDIMIQVLRTSLSPLPPSQTTPCFSCAYLQRFLFPSHRAPSHHRQPPLVTVVT